MFVAPVGIRRVKNREKTGGVPGTPRSAQGKYTYRLRSVRDKNAGVGSFRDSATIWMFHDKLPPELSAGAWVRFGISQFPDVSS
jgi:hypothetical protein